MRVGGDSRERQQWYSDASIDAYPAVWQPGQQSVQVYQNYGTTSLASLRGADAPDEQTNYPTKVIQAVRKNCTEYILRRLNNIIQAQMPCVGLFPAALQLSCVCTP